MGAESFSRASLAYARCGIINVSDVRSSDPRPLGTLPAAKNGTPHTPEKLAVGT